MRSLTGQDEAVLNAQDGYSVAARVWVWDGAAYQDVTALEGRDWLVEVAWDEGINDACGEATVTLRRQLEDYSLNPLVSNKLTGLLALGRAFYVEAATVPLGDPVASGDWREVFRGTVETLALDKDPLTFTGRDAGGALVKAYIETEREYGSDAGVAVETVLQSILTDNSTGVTLYVPTATGAVFSRFKQKKAPVLTAVRELALRIGWDVRYLWHDGTSAFRLTLIKPDRLGAVGSVWTFQPARLKRVTRLAQTVHDVRNAVKLFYYNRASLDAGGKATLSSVTAEDATSISTYGRNYLQLAEDEGSPIDSSAEAQVMANAARDDLKDPLLDFGVTVGFHYGIQLGDMLTFEADDIHFSSAQTLAVVSAAHSIGVRGHSTTLQLRGKPVGANAAWLRRDGRIRPQPPATAPDAVSGLAATATVGGGTITFTASTVPPIPVEFELHLSTTSGFTPSSSTLRELASRTRFEPTGLTAGTTYYAKIVSRDAVGNRGVSSEVSFTPRYVALADAQPYTAWGLFPPNPDFEAQTNTSAPPDKWAMTTGTWGTHAELVTDSYTGGKSLKLTGSGNAVLESELFLVRAGETWALDFFLKSTSTGLALVDVEVRWYSAVGTAISAEGFIGWTVSASGTWEYAQGVFYAPSTAKYASVRLSGTYGRAVWIDSVRVTPTSLPQEDYIAVSYSNSWANYGGSHETVGYRINSLGDVQLKGLAKAPASAPAAYASMFTLPTGYRPAAVRLWRLATSTGAIADVEFQTNGTVTVSAIAGGAYLSLEGLTFTPA